MEQTKAIQHQYSAIYDRLNKQPHLQEVISTFVLDLLYAEDKQVWETKNKHNQDLMIIEWKLFIECEMDLGEGLHGGDCNTEEAAASHIIHYIVDPGDKISPIGYDLGIEYTETINNLPDDYRRRIVNELQEEDRLHCKY